MLVATNQTPSTIVIRNNIISYYLLQNQTKGRDSGSSGILPFSHAQKNTKEIQRVKKNTKKTGIRHIWDNRPERDKQGQNLKYNIIYSGHHADGQIRVGNRFERTQTTAGARFPQPTTAIARRCHETVMLFDQFASRGPQHRPLICARDLHTGASPFCSGCWAGLPAGLFFLPASEIGSRQAITTISSTLGIASRRPPFALGNQA
ncbi:hypothetical protein [Ensifer adhaerens]|uniref:hypothetical protein n=1 Tax=Ensifer adhaerens TaxID=106592 RepID=UPI0011784F8E|nr:hypothetical protein [Ensifer adhaerens]